MSIALARNLFVVGEDRCRATEIDVEITAFEALDVTHDDFAFAGAVFLDDRSALRFTNLLHDDLFGCLSGDATEIFLSLERK